MRCAWGRNPRIFACCAAFRGYYCGRPYLYSGSILLLFPSPLSYPWLAQWSPNPGFPQTASKDASNACFKAPTRSSRQWQAETLSSLRRNWWSRYDLNHGRGQLLWCRSIPNRWRYAWGYVRERSTGTPAVLRYKLPLWSKRRGSSCDRTLRCSSLQEEPPVSWSPARWSWIGRIGRFWGSWCWSPPVIWPYTWGLGSSDVGGARGSPGGLE